MPSQYKENYLYYAGKKEIKSIQFFGKNKKETDEKFKAFLIEFNENRNDTPLFKDFINEKYRKTLGLVGLCDNHDWRANYGTQLKEANLSSAQVADLLGHADTRMVETVYAVTRHQGVMKHQGLLNAINPYALGTAEAPTKPANAQYIRVLEDAFAT